MKIAILGYGTVGKGVFELAKANNIEVKKVLMSSKKKVTETFMTADINDILLDKEIDLVVECMGGLEPARSYVISSLKNGKYVVTSNKKMMATYYSEVVNVAKENNVNIKFSSACGGGIPWLFNLDNLKKQDEILSLYGIMNGTSNYILDSIFVSDMSFMDALKIAQDLGYAEKDPTDDIDGFDTSFKTTLSANTAFNVALNPSDMLIKGIRDISDKEIKYCKDRNLRIALKGDVKKVDGKIGCAVYPEFVSKDSPLYSVAKNYNCFVLNSKNLDSLTFKGQGAGMYPTASNVILDIRNILENTKCDIEINEGKNSDEILVYKFYLRTDNISKFEDLLEEKLDDNIFITKEISIKELRERLKDSNSFIARV